MCSEIPNNVLSSSTNASNACTCPKQSPLIIPSRQDSPMHPLLRLLSGLYRLLKHYRLLGTTRLCTILEPVQAEQRHIIQSSVFFLFWNRPHIRARFAPRMWSRG